MEEMNPLSQAIVAGNLEQTQQLVRQALAEGMDTQTLINDYLTTGMAEIGQRFQELFHSSVRSAFHLSLTVLVHYRSLESI